MVAGGVELREETTWMDVGTVTKGQSRDAKKRIEREREREMGEKKLKESR